MACDCPTNGNFSDNDGNCTSCPNNCHAIVDTYAEVAQFRNAFVTVRQENAVYHIDDVGNAILISRPAIFASSTYTPTTGDYHQVVVYKFSTNQFFVFDPSGNFKTGTLA